MYASHFGLRQDPFSIAPDPRYLYLSERHREALAHLLYGLDGGGGFVLLTGEIGAGKTTVCRCFLAQVPAHCQVAYIVNPQLDALELVQAVCEEFGLAGPENVTQAQSVRHWTGLLNQFLLQAHAQGRHCVLVIDEAQQLSAQALEQLRLLTNLETHERKLLQIVLIGQPELRELLARPELEQLAQRVIARYHLQALSAEETRQYIAHRLAVAGWRGPLPFDRAALRQIQQLSRGVPRRINLLCGRALLGAYAAGQRMVSGAMVARAAHEVFDAGEAACPSPARWAGRLALLLGAVAVLVGAAWLAADRLAWTVPPLQAESSSASLPQPRAPAASLPLPAAPAVPASESTAEPAVASLPAPATSSEAEPAPLDDQALAAAWAKLPRQEAQAWREVGVLWQAPQVPTGEPCKTWAAHDLQCFKSARTSLATLRLLDRPGLLTLVNPQGRSAYVLLTGFDSEHALLQLQGKPQRVPITLLSQWWRGDFATLWRAPPGYPGDRQALNSAAVAQWLATQLEGLPDSGAVAPAEAEAAKTRLYQFQLAQGLLPDGRAGPMTFMQLNRAVGLDEPRLYIRAATPAETTQ